MMLLVLFLFLFLAETFVGVKPDTSNIKEGDSTHRQERIRDESPGAEARAETAPFFSA